MECEFLGMVMDDFGLMFVSILSYLYFFFFPPPPEVIMEIALFRLG